MGNEVDAFEKEFASFHGEDLHAIEANGTDAIALSKSWFGTGDEIITPSHTAVATILGLNRQVAPLCLQIRSNTKCIAPSQLRREWVPIPVRSCQFIYGQPAEMHRIGSFKAHNLVVIEDCSQAHGAEINGQKVNIC